MTWVIYFCGMSLLTLSIVAMDQKPSELVRFSLVGTPSQLSAEDDGWQCICVHTPNKSNEDAIVRADKTRQTADEILAAVRNGAFAEPLKIQHEQLKQDQISLFTLARRTSPLFPAEVVQSQQENVASVRLDPRKAYEYFGYSPEEGAQLPYSYFKTKIEEARKDPRTPEQRKRELRQWAYVFSCQESQDEYNAYLKGTSELAKLMLPSAQSKLTIQQKLNENMQRIAAITGILQQYDAVAQSIPLSFPKEETIVLW